MRRPSASRCPTRRSRLIRSTWSRWPGAPSTTCAAPSGTPRASRARPKASGSRTCAGRCARRPSSSPTANASRSPRSSRPTPACTALTCSRSNYERSTISTTPPTRPSTSTPGWRGRRDRSWRRSSGSRARCAATATASSPPSPSDSPTPASKACTPRSGCSHTAASASTPPRRSSPSSQFVGLGVVDQVAELEHRVGPRGVDGAHGCVEDLGRQRLLRAEGRGERAPEAVEERDPSR